ncbi:MAG: UDP-3-O-acyl-N-acetylglucosamine deacetylase [Thermodesulfobacteriota bacterium]
MMQTTIKKEIVFSGVGLHTGCDVRVRLLPAEEDSGVRFIRKDLPGFPSIKADGANVVNTNYATTLGAGGVTVSTVEHILAALYGLGVDNVDVEVYGSEIPILDGSAGEFIKKIEAAGLIYLMAEREYLVVKSPIKVSDGDKYLMLLPSNEPGLRIDYSIDFSHPVLSKQLFSRQCTREVFINEIGNARTFGFLSDIETLRANGLAMGGSLSNAVVVGESNILNEDGLRYPDEFVRHKALDLLGDLSLVGAPVSGQLIAHRSGHALNHRLLQKIARQRPRWELERGIISSMHYNNERREAVGL